MPQPPPTCGFVRPTGRQALARNCCGQTYQESNLSSVKHDQTEQAADVERQGLELSELRGGLQALQATAQGASPAMSQGTRGISHDCPSTLHVEVLLLSED
jgi:hypothetical protein